MNEKPDCFIIMPISDPEGYSSGHFKHVYDNIIRKSCELAGYNPVRADEAKAANLIQLEILKQLLDAPMAVCDLSSRNPNVLFELGIRQAFDKPVVLIQEAGTPKIFDIAPLRYLEYSKEMKYHDVLRVQKELQESITATATASNESGNVNSIVKLLALSSPALIPDLKGGKEELALEVMQAELREMRKFMEIAMMDRGRPSKRGAISAVEYERISQSLEKLTNGPRSKSPLRHEQVHRLIREAEELMMGAEDKADHMHFRRLMERLHRAMDDMAREDL
jgi:hypothetical protein